jgi:hypothetical protein
VLIHIDVAEIGVQHHSVTIQYVDSFGVTRAHVHGSAAVFLETASQDFRALVFTSTIFPWGTDSHPKTFPKTLANLP